jgi:hypothetical protein
MTMRRKLSLLVSLTIACLAPASASAYLPHGFIGISPQTAPSGTDYELMRKAGVESLRYPLFWNVIQADSGSPLDTDWSSFDHTVALAAESHMRVMPLVFGSPDWVAQEAIELPVRTAWQRWGWSSFLRAAVDRYGPDGEFWEENPELPFLPIHKWEIWNEENLVTFAKNPDPARYATLLRISGRVLHRADPQSKVLVGGLFGRPLQTPPNITSGSYVAQLYKAGNVKPFFDGVALHPYVGTAGEMGAQLTNLRRIMRKNGDPLTPLYVTELGWGSDDGPTRWQRGVQGQAEELSRSFELLSRNRGRWHVGGVWWFTWSDEGGSCIFCSSAGLLTTSREAKPSWYRFNEWTGGNADTVPRARLGE